MQRFQLQRWQQLVVAQHGNIKAVLLNQLAYMAAYVHSRHDRCRLENLHHIPEARHQARHFQRIKRQLLRPAVMPNGIPEHFLQRRLKQDSAQMPIRRIAMRNLALEANACQLR